MGQPKGSEFNFVAMDRTPSELRADNADLRSKLATAAGKTGDVTLELRQRRDELRRDEPSAESLAMLTAIDYALAAFERPVSSEYDRAGAS